MPISTKLHANLRKTLLCCDELSDFQQLRAMFVNASIYAWQGRLRKANSASDQVNLLIDQLGKAYNSTVAILFVLRGGVMSELDTIKNSPNAPITIDSLRYDFTPSPLQPQLDHYR